MKRCIAPGSRNQATIPELLHRFTILLGKLLIRVSFSVEKSGGGQGHAAEGEQRS
jgi:hypothetical protein